MQPDSKRAAEGERTDASQPPSADEFFMPHSMRLFPKRLGARAYRITGIAGRCDWVLLSDSGNSETHLHRTVDTEQPGCIFLSLRNGPVALHEFAHTVLPQLTKPFVLVSGSEDVTLPVQLDQRFGKYRDATTAAIRSIADHPLLIRWFAENLSDDSNPVFSPIPTGMVYPDGHPPMGIAAPSPPPLAARPLTAFCAHRTRTGPQWDLRRKVSSLAATDWGAWCRFSDSEMPERNFFTELENHSFVLCVEGGGLDPSPKAWQSILHGAIPIIRETGTRQAYRELPVAFVPDWAPSSLDPDRLQDIRRRLAPFYDDIALRRQVITRLGLDFWWNKIKAAALSR